MNQRKGNQNKIPKEEFEKVILNNASQFWNMYFGV